MQRPVCTIDTSSIIALDHVGLVPELSWLFSRVLLPKAVRAELFKRREMKDRVRAIMHAYKFVKPCDHYDQAAVSILSIEHGKLGVRDRGEVEAVVQAAQIGAVVIIDDRWGRTLAEHHELAFHGVLWVLRRLAELGLASPAVTRNRILELYRRGIRLPRKEVDGFLIEIGEPPITKAGGAENRKRP